MILSIIKSKACLKIGDPVLRTNQPLSIELGPGKVTPKFLIIFQGLVGQIFDGIQRPLETHISGKALVHKGEITSGLDPSKLWEFFPNTNIKIDSLISEGDVIGHVFENNLFREHKILLPPKAKGKVTYTAPGGFYTVKDKIIEVENNTKIEQYTMSHKWPVRQPRPYIEKIPSNELFITGQRVIDVLFPSVLGGACSFGSTTNTRNFISRSLSSHSNSDLTIYVGCEKTEEEAQAIVKEFRSAIIFSKDKEENLINKTCLITNTVNMPLASQEASILSGITIAEYFRDMGYNVSFIVDSITKWVRAIRETKQTPELPTGFGYSSYISSRVGQIYERAGRVQCFGSQDRKGSLTFIGALTPPNGDFAGSASIATLISSRVTWFLEEQLAQKNHFPPINWRTSFAYDDG